MESRSETAVVQDRRGMVRRDERGGPEGQDFAAELPEVGRGSDQSPEGRRAEGHEDPRVDRSDFCEEVGPTRDHLVRPRPPVARGTALDDIRDEEPGSRGADRGEGGVEDFPGGSREGPSGGVFRTPRRFANQEDDCTRGPFARDRMSPADMEPAKGAGTDPRGDPLQVLRARCRLRHGPANDGRDRKTFAKPQERRSALRFVRALIFGCTFSIFPSSFVRRRSNRRSAFKRSIVVSLRSCWARRMSAR